MDNKELIFLRESNDIEGEYSVKALEDAVKAWEFAKKYKGKINVKFITDIHKILMWRLNKRIAGRIRKCKVWVGNKTHFRECLSFKEIKKELELLCNETPKTKEDIKEWHVNFEGIHPFEDGNGRTGRILMNIQRLRIGLPILIIHEGREQFEYYKWFRHLN